MRLRDSSTAQEWGFGSLEAKLVPRAVHRSSFGHILWCLCLGPSSGGRANLSELALLPAPGLTAGTHQSSAANLGVSTPSQLSFSPGDTTCSCHTALISLGFSHTYLSLNVCWLLSAGRRGIKAAFYLIVPQQFNHDKIAPPQLVK